MEKVNVLTVGQTPPPFGGQAISIQNILRGSYRNLRFFHVRMSFSKEMDEIGKLRLLKIFKLPAIVLKIIYMRFRHNILILHYPPAGPDRIPMYRDLAILLSTRFLFHKTIFYFNAAGISELYKRLRPWERFLFRRAYFAPDLAVRQSDFSPPDGEFLQAKKNVVIPSAEPDRFPKFSAPRRQNRNEPVPVLLFVGVVRESKGIMDLLDASRILRDAGLSFQTQIMGKFASEEFSKKAREFVSMHNLGEVVQFLGVRTAGDKWQTYAKADVMVFPTFFESESFPRVLVEAVQFELPVVATRWRGIPSIVEDGKSGFLVPINDGRALAEKIALLLKNPSLRLDMGERGRQIYLERFTIERFWRDIEEAFLSVTD
ncbi:MAG: glycosyltransferase family 4 protein [Bacteroidales bacterium]